MFKSKSKKLSKEQKELREITEEILQSSAKLKYKISKDTKTFIEKYRKFYNDGEIEINQIHQIADKLNQEVKKIMSENRNLMTLDAEKRYVHFTEESENDKCQKKLLTKISIVVVSFATICLASSGYLLYVFIISPTQISKTFNIITLLPFIVMGFIILVGTFIVQYYQIFSSLSDFKKFKDEKIELAQTIYSLEDDLIKILEFSDSDKELSLIQGNVEKNEKPLWKKYDAVIVNVLYKNLKPKS